MFVQSNKLPSDLLGYPAPKAIALEDRFKSDFFILCGIAVIGLIGCVYLLVLCNQPTYNAATFQDYSLISNDQEPSKILVMGIEYSGSCTIGNPLSFNIPTQNADGKLLIDYGNGDNQIVSKASVSYSYDRLGVYNVRLLQIKEDGLHTLANQYVEIAPKF